MNHGRGGGAATVAILLITVLPARAAEAPSGAAACSGCHAASVAVDTPVPRLAGRDSGELFSALLGFKSGLRSATVMDRIAKGFTNEELMAIATWYSEQKE